MIDFPPVGLGTMGIDDPDVIATALDVGYRHLDTAQIYDNEAVVGDGLARSDVAREEVTVATKLWIDDLGGDRVRASTRESLDRLGLEAVDLLYVHRPRGAYDPAETLPALDALYADGLVDAIGVSNFSIEQVETASEYLDAPIVANQVEFHPLFQQDDLVSNARANEYTIVGYSPLANGQVFEMPEITAIAERHGVNPATVAIAWVSSDENVVTIPKASTREHLETNLAAADFDLDPAAVERIEGIEREQELFPE
jgi:2,5-diketo-D-gluconate reductase B